MRVAPAWVSVALIAGLAACSTTTKLVNKDGQERYCYRQHEGSWDMIPAAEQYNKCLNEAGKEGYQIVK